MSSAPPRLISRAELAGIAKVSRTAITKACKKQLAAACVDDRIDLDHAAVAAYLASRSIAVPPRETKAAAAPASKPSPKPERKRAGKPLRAPRVKAQAIEVHVAPEDGDEEDLDGPGEDEDPGAHVGAYKAMTLEEIVDRHGSKRSFKDWLEAVKKIEDIRKTRLDNDETEGRLIDRELVKTHVFGALEALNRRLLTDMIKTNVRRIFAIAKSGAPVAEAERLLRDGIETQLEAARATAARNLRKKKT